MIGFSWSLSCFRRGAYARTLLYNDFCLLGLLRCSFNNFWLEYNSSKYNFNFKWLITMLNFNFLFSIFKRQSSSNLIRLLQNIKSPQIRTHFIKTVLVKKNVVIVLNNMLFFLLQRIICFLLFILKHHFL